MILSHKHKFIYVKCGRVASSSIEWALAKICGPDDILTPLDWEDGQMYMQHCLRPGADPEDWVLSDLLYDPHIGAHEIREKFPEEWEDYWTFCTVRNPWDRVISQYYHQCHEGWGVMDLEDDPASLSECLDQEALKLRISNWRFYTDWDSGEVIVDYVMRFEQLYAEVVYIESTLGFDLEQPFPHIGGDVRTDRRHYTEVLSVQDAVAVAVGAAEEIREFGYKF